jgi:hypothetical protein
VITGHLSKGMQGRAMNAIIVTDENTHGVTIERLFALYVSSVKCVSGVSGVDGIDSVDGSSVRPYKRSISAKINHLKRQINNLVGGVVTSC